jgi:hypothetical protein
LGVWVLDGLGKPSKINSKRFGKTELVLDGLGPNHPKLIISIFFSCLDSFSSTVPDLSNPRMYTVVGLTESAEFGQKPTLANHKILSSRSHRPSRFRRPSSIVSRIEEEERERERERDFKKRSMAFVLKRKNKKTKPKKKKKGYRRFQVIDGFKKTVSKFI